MIKILRKKRVERWSGDLESRLDSLGTVCGVGRSGNSLSGSTPTRAERA
jgi:hypothetical protein